MSEIPIYDKLKSQKLDFEERELAEWLLGEMGHNPDEAAHAFAAACSCIADLEAKLAEAEAAIAKLPRTADGVPLTPSMTVFNRMAEPMDVLYVEALMVRTSRGWFDVDACYSTPEAAKEARDAT